MQDIAARERKTQVTLYKPPADYTVLRYDYTTIDEAHRQTVQDAALDIRQREKRAAEDMMAIGQRLIEVKEWLPHGAFQDWIAQEFGYSGTIAKQLMNVARRFGSKTTLSVVLSATVLRLLAAPSVPDAAIDETVAVAQTQGKPVKVSEVKQIIAAHKPPPAPAKVRQPVPATIMANYTVFDEGRSEGSAPTTLPEANPGTAVGAAPAAAAKVTLSLDRTVAEKLYIAMTTHSLRRLSKDEQAQLIQALEVILAP